MDGKHCWNSISAKNHFSGARACTCVTREQYGVSQIGLHSGIERYVRYNVISISKSEIIARWSIFPDIANAVMAGALVRTGPLQCVCTFVQGRPARLLAWLATVPFVLCVSQFITGVRCMQLSFFRLNTLVWQLDNQV